MHTHFQDMIESLGRSAKQTLALTAQWTDVQKQRALLEIANAVQDQAPAILAANALDMTQAQKKRISPALLDRLRLDDKRIVAMVEGIKAIAILPDPVNRELATWQRPNGLTISRMSVPLGVIAVIYESRPNVTIDAAALCLKAGNVVILRGGSECFHSNQALLNAIHTGLAAAGLPLTAVQMVPTPDRAAVTALLQADQYIDVVVPRGGKSLIETITTQSRIPLFKHLDGVCHTYLHNSANVDMAVEVVLNAKMRRTGICGATETILVDAAAAAQLLPKVLTALVQAGCEIRADEAARTHFPNAQAALDSDWDTEYLDAIVAVKVVKDIDEALAHIAAHGSHHTDAIIADDAAAAELFLQRVDSAIVMHNASTQFADGGEFGMGAEIGIATGRLHARGPVGVEQLTTYKYCVRGKGQIRSV